MVKIDIDPNFGLVVLEAVALCALYYIITWVVVLATRFKTFPNKWLIETFKEEHKKSFPNEGDTKVGLLGFPDNGNGLYSQKLTYKQWYDFQSA